VWKGWASTPDGDERAQIGQRRELAALVPGPNGPLAWWGPVRIGRDRRPALGLGSGSRSLCRWIGLPQPGGGTRLLSAELSARRFHRADLVRVADGEPPEAIEVELAAKGATRLEELLRAWRRAVAEGRLSRVTYRCSPRTRSLLERAVERTSTQGAITIRHSAG
jgi:hypothetical protein